VGVLPTGPLNAITDVAGVRVGHVTRIEGNRVRTGVTAILPHGGNPFQAKVPAAVFRANGFGKLAGSTQVEELGEIESPILLTNTLGVAEALAGGLDWLLALPGNETVRSANVVVGETNDGFLNDIRARPLARADARAAIEAAGGGPVAEGNVGAGTGTRLFGWKGGIGTSSRVVGEWTLGVLVQANFGGRPLVLGRPVPAGAANAALEAHVGDGSVMVVVATDAPLSDRNLARLARRAVVGLARTGSSIDNGSGDYIIAFSTHEGVRRTPERRARPTAYPELPNEAMSPLFAGVAEATEEAVLNALLQAETLDGLNGRLEAFPPALLPAP
jgi:D-aminopeptidase